MQSGAGARGAEMDPSSTRVGKHSRSCAVSVAERDHVYSRHASPRRHVCRCEEFEGENAAHSPRSGCRRLPQEWHCSPGTPVSCTCYSRMLQSVITPCPHLLSLLLL